MTSLVNTCDYDNFDPNCYMETRDWNATENKEERNIFLFNVDALHELFHSGCIKGQTLLDIGTGPTIRTLISASSHVERIYLSDINEQNRATLRKWWRGEKLLEVELTDYILKKENVRHSAEDRQQTLKGKIQEILPIDVRSRHPLPKEDGHGNFDVIISSLCFESASQSKEEYCEVVQNVASLLKIGGHLVVLGLFDNTHYDVGNYRFICASLSRDVIENIYETNGFTILTFSSKKMDTCEKVKP
ncbi:nicotinamide N-methyltransferase-like [Ylistrum balloti]|uniref:nicotinamide N-methyltransferase-like n=1 Tax=Ylistrum balloti TaxID=509963 RepID=UPI00290584D2|nr:nicotinamide N-methyltransferase-like [Ylistrum balloti]